MVKIFEKETENTQWKKDGLFKSVVLRKLDQHMQDSDIGTLSYNTHTHKVNLTSIMDIRPDTIKLGRKHRVEIPQSYPW